MGCALKDGVTAVGKVSQPPKPTSPCGPTKPCPQHAPFPPWTEPSHSSSHVTSSQIPPKGLISPCCPSPAPAWGPGGTGESRSTHHFPPLWSPTAKGLCWSWGGTAVGVRRSHFCHQKQLRLPGTPSCPLPGACVPPGTAAGSGVGPTCPQLAERGRMAELHCQGCVYKCHLYIDLIKTAGK